MGHKKNTKHKTHLLTFIYILSKYSMFYLKKYILLFGPLFHMSGFTELNKLAWGD